MSSTRLFHMAFWVFIGGMLLWQFAAYNHHLDQKIAAAGPQQQHFFYNAKTMAPPVPPKPDAADVRQVDFSTSAETPSPGNFTCHVVLKNEGKLKAVNVQIKVAPFRGAWAGNPDGDGRNSNAHPLTNNDSVTQISQWVSFPDMAPGETVSRDVTFINQSSYNPGNNSHPTITFQSENSKSAAPTPVPAR